MIYRAVLENGVWKVKLGRRTVISPCTSKWAATEIARTLNELQQEECRGAIAQAGVGDEIRVDGPSRARGPIVPSRVELPAAELPRQKVSRARLNTLNGAANRKSLGAVEPAGVGAGLTLGGEPVALEARGSQQTDWAPNPSSE